MGCCNGSTFTPAPGAALDPSQRVNYSFGMVLGVDDFRQEQAYLMARDERLARELIGYGVISGLHVSAGGDEVRVTPGSALTPQGKLVAVVSEQCANLKTWLDSPSRPPIPTGGGATVYVRLRHAELSGTPVPIPGEPCRDESELSADARLADSFELDFAWTPPSATEDLALRAGVAWIRSIKVAPTASPVGLTLASFQAAVETGLRAAIAAWGVPASPAQPSAVLPALPAPPASLRIPRAQLSEYYAAAFDVWLRLLRSGVMAHHGPVPPADPTPETWLLLGAVDVATRKESMLGRPELVHLRWLQEWLLRDSSHDAPAEAHFVLGKGDPALTHAQDLLTEFSGRDHALTRIDLLPDTTDGGSGNKAFIKPAVKWPGGATGDVGGPDYYGPRMAAPILVRDGGTNQTASPTTGALLVGRSGATAEQSGFELGALAGVGATPNITVSLTASPTILLDTVQDIGPTASPIFTSLHLTDSLSVEKNIAVVGDFSVSGNVDLGAPLASVLATDSDGLVGAARPWDGDEELLDSRKVAYAYLPGQPAPVRVEDGGTGLQTRPSKMQVLIGVEQDESLRSDGGDYVQATLEDGKNTTVTLTPPRLESRTGWQLRIDAAGGAATQVLAAGNATKPPSLTAVTTGNQVLIDSVQALHQAAAPTFSALTLTAPPTAAADALVGWRKSTGQLVLTEAPQGGAADVGKWPLRYVRKPNEMEVRDTDQVLVVLINGGLRLPVLGDGKISEGRVIVVRAGPGVTDMNLSGFEGNGSTGMKSPSSLTLIAATLLDPPQWLIIGRS